MYTCCDSYISFDRKFALYVFLVFIHMCKFAYRRTLIWLQFINVDASI